MCPLILFCLFSPYTEELLKYKIRVIKKHAIYKACVIYKEKFH